jgi:TRAP transporter TAXI family solute receptor
MMKKNQSKKLALVLIGFAAAALVLGCGGGESAGAKSAQKVYMTFGASPASSQFYTYWVAVGKAVSTAYPEYQISVSETQGSVDSTKRVNSGELLVGISTSASDYDNYNGAGSFEGKPNKNARILWYFDVSPIQVVVSKESGITKMRDLQGKKFSPGGTGTSVAIVMRQMLQVLNIQPDLFEAGQGDAGDAVSNRLIVGATKAGIVPDSFVMQVAASIPIDVITMTDDEVTQINRALPYLVPVAIPPGSYKGVDHEIKTVQILQGAQASIQLPQEEGYKFIKAMCEGGKSVWTEAYPSGANIDILNLTTKSSIPLHSGSVQYLREKGYTVPQNLVPPEYKETK